MTEPLFTEAARRDAFGRVAMRLAAQAKIGEILIHGGATMVLADHLAAATAQEALVIHDRIFPDDALPEEKPLRFADALDQHRS